MGKGSLILCVLILFDTRCIATRMQSFRELIGCWESCEAMARDLGLGGEHAGLRVRQWKRRDSIPAELWRRVEAAAHQRGLQDITVGLMADLAAAKAAPAENEAA
jgi:hypothetical protein